MIEARTPSYALPLANRCKGSAALQTALHAVSLLNSCQRIIKQLAALDMPDPEGRDIVTSICRKLASGELAVALAMDARPVVLQ
jgi:hypothetical protein